MPTPGKTVKLIKMEGKSHRTKAELRKREEAENALLTGKDMQPWDTLDDTAKKEFRRIKKLLKNIDKNDALYENVINRYCELKSECIRFQKLINQEVDNIDEAKNAYHKGEMDITGYITFEQKAKNAILSLDRQIQTKRKMMLDIEKENIMTIASALRTIPKKEEKNNAPTNGMSKFIKRNGTGGV